MARPPIACGLGKDTASGGGRHPYAFNAAAERGVGTAKRDAIVDFAHLSDEIDLMGSGVLPLSGLMAELGCPRD